MIITRSPLRISLGGGGTDVPSYYEKHGGFLIAGAIDKYVYITLHHTFVPEISLKYSKIERVKRVEEVEHPIVREALRLVELSEPSLEMASMADIPAGTGLGSSGSFTTALLMALHTWRKQLVTPERVAREACEIEIGRLKEPIGKQDQYIAAYGGLTCFSFHPDGSVETRPLRLPAETIYNLEDNLMLFFTGFARSASAILQDQDKRSREGDPAMIDNLHYVKDLGMRSLATLEEGNLRGFARLMDEHWQHKKKRSPGMSNSSIDEWYEIAKAHGALGGKVLGAGGGGFLLFYSEEKVALRRAMATAGLKEVRFRFDFEGTKVIVQ